MHRQISITKTDRVGDSWAHGKTRIIVLTVAS